MVRPDRYVCQSWHVAAKVIIQPYLRKSRRSRIEEEEKEEDNSEEESEQFETVIPSPSEAPFFTAREDDDYSVTEHSPSLLSEASQTLQEEEDGINVGRVTDVSKTFIVDQAPNSMVSRKKLCKNMTDEDSKTLINEVFRSKTLKRSPTLVDDSSEVSETLISKASTTLVNNEISCSNSLSCTLIPFPATAKFHSVVEDPEDLKSDQVTSVTLANPTTKMVSLQENMATLMDPPPVTILANSCIANLEEECKKDGGTKQSEGIQFGEALRQVDKFLEETEQYLAGQGFNLLAENENFNLRQCKSPVTEQKGKTTGRQKPRKLVVPKSFVDEGDSPATDLVGTSQLSSISRTLLPDEKSGVCKEERTYKSKWFDKIKNKFEKTEDDIPSKRKTGSNEITYDEIDDDSDGPYMPTSEVVEEKLKEEEEFYQHPPPPRPLPKKIEAMENDPDKIAVEHIYEEIAPRIVTPVRYRRRRPQNIADPDGKADTGEVVEKPAKTKTTSCISSLATCIPWWMAKRFYWKKDRKSEAKFMEEAKRNSKIRARQSYA